jgi:pimeloyl-ACP methyl ester carboxylesterase
VYERTFVNCDELEMVQALMEELGIYLLSFDRPGYAESDAHPGRTEKSIALDIQDLADNLQLAKFHLIGFSMGGEIMWSCLKYIPHRSGTSPIKLLIRARSVPSETGRIGLED